MKDSDAFLVLPVLKDREPDAERVPVPILVPQRSPVFSPILNKIMGIFMIINPSLLYDFDKYNNAGKKPVDVT